MPNPEIPLFVELDGCTNCPNWKLLEDNIRKHEFVLGVKAACHAAGCADEGFLIPDNPYIPPAKLRELAENAQPWSKDPMLARAKDYERRFGKYYSDPALD